MLDSIISLFSSYALSTFDRPWVDNKFRYQALSTIAFSSVCDFSKGGVVFNELQGSSTINACGESCSLLKDAFGGSSSISSFQSYSLTDHVSMVTLTSGDDVYLETSVNSNLNGNIFMSFRGTFVWDLVNKRRNSIMTLTLISICEGCAAQIGPYKNFVALRFVVLKDLNTAEKVVLAKRTSSCSYCPLPKVVVVGMSMGGQLANFNSIYLSQQQGKTISAVYTFGSPRVGNSVFAKFIKKIPNKQIAYYRDPVPHMPPRFLGYRTMGTDIYWIYVDPVFYAREARGEHDLKYEQYLHYKLFSGESSDNAFSSAVTFYSFHDHQRYFIGITDDSMATCGGFRDKFLLNTKGTSLFLS